MKTQKKEAKPFRFENSSGEFELNDRALRQFLNGHIGCEWREASRNSLKRFFIKQAAAGRKSITGRAWGKYSDWPRYQSQWRISLLNNCLWIGCIGFTSQQTRIIRRWALAL